MSQTIELPDPLFAEINGYAARVAASPSGVIKQAWDEFRHRHPQEVTPSANHGSTQEELLALVQSLKGSISLPEGVDDQTLIAEARLEKYGPL